MTSVSPEPQIRGLEMTKQQNQMETINVYAKCY